MHKQDPFQPMAIGINVHERDPFKFISYPNSPIMSFTDLPGNVDDHNGKDNSDHSDGHDDDDDNNIITSRKWKVDGTVVPFCKERLLNLMKEIATSEDPLNGSCYTKWIFLK